MELKYEEALKELEIISHRLENQEVSLEEMGGLVARAAELLAFCQAKLRKTEEDVQSIIDGMKAL